jgi:hypothetical protein
MCTRTLAAVVLAAAIVIPLRAAADEPTLLRVFLTDGTSLVSYGEPARASERVVFLMPTTAAPNPPLHLVNLPIGRVDWDRTSRYAATARASHYVATQAESDYAALSNDVVSTLNEIATTAAPSPSAIVRRACRLLPLAETHFNGRAAEVRQMLGLLDEAILNLERLEIWHAGTLSLHRSPAIVELPLPPRRRPGSDPAGADGGEHRRRERERMSLRRPPA